MHRKLPWNGMKASSKEPCMMRTVVLLILCALCVCVCLICRLRSSRPSSLSISIATLKEPARMETSTKPWRTKANTPHTLVVLSDHASKLKKKTANSLTDQAALQQTKRSSLPICCYPCTIIAQGQLLKIVTKCIIN